MERETIATIILLAIIAVSLLYFSGVLQFLLAVFQPKWYDIYIPEKWVEANVKLESWKVDDVLVDLKIKSVGPISIYDDRIEIPVDLEGFTGGEGELAIVWITLTYSLDECVLVPPERGVLKLFPTGKRPIYNVEFKAEFGEVDGVFPSHYVYLGGSSIFLRCTPWDDPDIDPMILTDSVEVKGGKIEVRITASKDVKGVVVLPRIKFLVSYLAEVEVTCKVNGLPTDKFEIYPVSAKINDYTYVIPIYVGENTFTVEWYGWTKTLTFNPKIVGDNPIPSKLTINFKVNTLKVTLTAPSENYKYLKKDLKVMVEYEKQNLLRTFKVYRFAAGSQLPLTIECPFPSSEKAVIVALSNDIAWIRREIENEMAEVQEATIQLPVELTSTTLAVPVEAETVTFQVQVILDENGAPVKNLPVVVQRASDLEVIKSELTDENGIATLTIPKDLEVYVYVKIGSARIFVFEGGPRCPEDGAVYLVKIKASWIGLSAEEASTQVEYNPEENTFTPSVEATEIQEVEDPIAEATNGEIESNPAETTVISKEQLIETTKLAILGAIITILAIAIIIARKHL